MPEPTLSQILDKLVDAIAELIELVKREMAAEGLQLLQDNGDTEDFETTSFSPAQSNNGTTTADLDALSSEQLDDWAEQNKAEVLRLMSP